MPKFLAVEPMPEAFGECRLCGGPATHRIMAERRSRSGNMRPYVYGKFCSRCAPLRREAMLAKERFLAILDEALPDEGCG